ncbi:hypothetical protein Tdes44962_MAKER04990 [Teratosphaeria destructans]|uniref:F-box domain-containing protein n=1 Tax=Teratosphaeria destructans TaxID=418781 RepID=A0A9W7VZ97_9PEZI|nr:hypothetical protein Tdes44962_MAKER04990 [Teratosphaeria destructans]
MDQQPTDRLAKPGLLSIPSELRLQIFGRVLPSDSWANFHIHGQVYDLMSRDAVIDVVQSPGRTDVLRVCRQFYDEASEVLHLRAHTTVTIRAPGSRAYSMNSLCLGHTDHTKTFTLLKDLKLVIELPRHQSDGHAEHLARIEAFVQSNECGRNLRKLVVVLRLPDGKGVPRDVEKYLVALSGLKFNGRVYVDFDMVRRMTMMCLSFADGWLV